MERYIVDGQPFDVAPHRLDDFLKMYPNASKTNSVEKTIDVAEPDVPATSRTNQTSEGTESNSENTSSASQPKLSYDADSFDQEYVEPEANTFVYGEDEPVETNVPTTTDFVSDLELAIDPVFKKLEDSYSIAVEEYGSMSQAAADAKSAMDAYENKNKKSFEPGSDNVIRYNNTKNEVEQADEKLDVLWNRYYKMYQDQGDSQGVAAEKANKHVSEMKGLEGLSLVKKRKDNDIAIEARKRLSTVTDSDDLSTMSWGEDEVENIEISDAIWEEVIRQNGSLEELDRISQDDDFLLNLNEKENIITSAKTNILNEKYDQYRSETSLLENSEVVLTKEFEAFDVQQKNVKKQLDLLGDVNENSSQQDIINYNNLVQQSNDLTNTYNALKSREKDLIEAYDKANDNLGKTYTELGYDAAKQAFNSNFAITDKIQNHKDRFILKSLETDSWWKKKAYEGWDAIATFANEGSQLMYKSSAGLGGFIGYQATRLYRDDTEYFDANEYLLAAFSSPGDVELFSESEIGSDISNIMYDPSNKSTFEQIVDPDAYNVNFRNATKMVADMLPFTLGIMYSGGVSTVAKGTSIYSKGASILSKSSTIARNSTKIKEGVRMLDATYRMTITDNYTDALNQGLDDNNALVYANALSMATGISQMIMPDKNFFKTPAGKEILAKFTGDLSKAVTKDATKKVAKQFVTNLGKELGEEQVEMAMQDIVKMSMLQGYEPEFFDAKAQRSVIVGTLLLSGSLGTVASKKNYDGAKKVIYDQYKDNAQDIINTIDADLELSKKHLQKVNSDKRYNQKSKDFADANYNQIFETKQHAIEIRNAIKSAPETVTTEQLDLLIQKQKLVNSKQNVDKAFHSDIDSKIDGLNNSIQNSEVIKNREKILDATTKNVNKISGNLVQSFNTTEDLKLKLIQEGYSEEDADYNSRQEGFFNEKTNELYMNRSVSLSGGNSNVAAHEYLHKMIANTVNNDPKIAKQVAQGLGSFLADLDPKQFTNSTFVRKLELYQTTQGDVNQIVEQNPGATEKEINKLIQQKSDFDVHQQAVEVITLASDALASGDITVETTSITKIKDFLRRTGNKIKGTPITFNTGEDVFNFLKDYNRSVKKGQLSEAQKALVDGKKIEGALTQVENEIKTESTAGQQQSRSEASAAVQQIYEERGLEGIFDIIEAFKPITNRLARKYSEVPGYDEEMLMTEIELSQRGLYGLVSEYKQESGVPLAAWINKYLPARAIEAAKKILKENFEADITEAKGVAAEETVEQQPERKTKLKVLADQLNVSEQVDGAVANADVDVTSIFSFKSVPNAVAGTVGELMGISPAKIKSKANLTKSELANAQRFIKKNIGVLIGMMPEGFDSSGKATGVPKTMLDAFYTKRESRAKTKAGLQTQVKRSNIKDSEFLEVFNIFEGVPDRSDRNTSARVIALANLMGKVMTNQSIRKQNPSVVSIADGMSKIMFSKEVNLNTLEGINNTIEWGLQGGFASQPKSYWMKGLHGSGAKNTNIEEDGKQVYLDENNNKTFKKTKTKLKRYPLKTGGSILNNDPNFSESTINHVPASKGIFANATQRDAILNKYEKDGGKFLPASETYQAASDRTTVYGKKTGEQVKALINKNQDKFNKSEKGFIDYWLNIKEDIKNNPKNEKYWAALLEVTSTNQSSFMRVGSRLIGYNTLGLENREEHMSPASDFAKYLFQGVKDGWLTRRQMKQAMKSYTQISLPLIYDKMLSGVGIDGKPFDYTKVLPKEFAGLPVKIQILQGMIPNWVRYINPNVNAMPYTLNGKQYYGMNPNVLVLGDGRNLAQTYGLGVDSSLEMNQDVISVQQELLFKVFMNNITKAEAVSQLNDYVSNVTPAAPAIAMFSKNIDANKTNVNPRGITILDFDDTLATTKSGVRYTMPNPSGKPQPKRKAILIAGNAGAGKTTVINQLGLRKQGFKYINQDIALDWLTKNNGLPKDMNEFTREQTDKWRELGGQAAVAAKNKASKLRGQGDGVVIDGTGAVGVQFEGMAREFKNAGYDVQVVFIESSLETALERNANRSERRLTDATVRNAYEATQKNKKAFKEMVTFFPYSAKGFVEINTDNLKQGGALPSNLVETMDNFTKGYIKGRLNAEEFASQGQTLLGEGAEFDFSEFNKVVEGKTAPLFNKAMKLQGKFGPENMFVLTARPAEAQGPIFDFLKANGLNIPLKNITGLGNSTAEAKALWVAGKFSEGYNDFYFADDAIQNVEAVRNMLDQFDVKSKVQQAKVQFSKTLNPKFNEMLERSAGVGAQKIFSRVEAAKRGKNKGKFTFFVPPSAEDFTGLLRYFAGTGKQGDADIQFFNEALVKPFARADRAMSQMKQSIRDDYSALRKKFPDVKKKLGKLVEGTTFTNDMAVRVYLFDKAGYEIPGLSKQGKVKLLNTVKKDPEMRAFADALGIISKQKDGYLKPGEYWNTENIALDLQNATNKVGRKQFLQEWVQNKEIIFSPENMNKIEAVYGTQFREALEDILFRMENGTNRSKDRTYGQNWTNWVNNSVGAIMFFNARSSVLQTLSTVNFINFEDNNIFAAGKAFANQKQYWSDFSFLFNSDFLKNRRAGLATNVNEAELASAVAGATNKAKAALGYLLKIGFTPTQIADSFAIASGGATYYRNRIKTYIKSGMSQDQAEARAMLDFQEIAEETQQSARPDRISQQQASPLGRIILAFANTPMQYNRLIKKAAGDLVNKRGNWKSNVSRILYYGAIQNFIFASLQNALFALTFDDDDEELTDAQQTARDRKEETKKFRILNSMFDSLARGSGVYGAALSTIKNAVFEFYEQEERGFRADYNEVVIELLNVSPPIGSKVRKISSAGKTRRYSKDVMKEMSMLDYDNPAWQAISNLVEATTNIPMARAVRKIDNLRESFNQENSAMQRVFLALGWSAWDLGVGTEVVKNEGKKNEYVVTLDTKRMNQYEVEKELDEKNKEQKKIENKAKKEEKQVEAESKYIEDQKQEKKEDKEPRCAGSKSNGERCKGKPVDGTYCTIHQKVEKRSDGKEVQCSGKRTNGDNCKMNTTNKSGLCFYHD